MSDLNAKTLAVIERACESLWEAEKAVRELAAAGVVIESQLAEDAADLAELLDHLGGELRAAGHRLDAGP